MLAMAEAHGCLELKDNGEYSFELKALPNAPQAIALAYGFTDVDGDALSGEILINI